MQTCCQTCEIYATPGDVQRIAAFTGENNFVEFRASNDPAYHDHDDDPAWRDNVFRADGSRRVLARQGNGDCRFLGEKGCILPLETRPLVCRLYPFQYSAEGIETELATGCPLELLSPGQGLIDALEMNRQDAQRWHAQLYQEILLEPEGRAATTNAASP